jgi:protein-S-isoprenylcysteine O-methyltransferase Ste14
MMLTRYQLITICFWLVSELYWGFHASGNKETVHQQKTFVRTFAVMSVYLAFALIYVPYLSIGLLAIRIVPQNDFFGVAGVLLCASGISFSIWSRKTLGKNWSGPVSLKKGHELIRKGPYKIVRHPIYFGSLVSLTGSAVTTTELRAFCGVLVVFYSLLKKIDEEETLLATHFEEYAEYILQVKKLIPFVY